MLMATAGDPVFGRAVDMGGSCALRSRRPIEPTVKKKKKANELTTRNVLVCDVFVPE